MRHSILLHVAGGLGLTLALPALAHSQTALFDSAARSFHTGDWVIGEAYRPHGQALVDLDGDGDLDVALAHYSNSIEPRFCVLLNHGDGTYTQPVSVRTTGETADIVAADLDGDGDQDLAFAQSSVGIGGGWVLVFPNLGNATFGAERRFATGMGSTGIVALDVDADGDLDLATANWGFNEHDVSVLKNDGQANFTQRQDFPIPGEQPIRLAAGDLNGDGRPDLAVSVRGGIPAVALLFNNGAGGFGAPVQYQSNYQFNIEMPGIGLGDVDLDGDLDVLYSAAQEQPLLIYTLGLFRNNGNGTLAPVEPIKLANSFGSMFDVSVADVTLDGWPDIIAVGYGSHRGFVIAESAGGGTFGASRSYRAGETTLAVDTGDVDGDGDLDVVMADSGSLTITVQENRAGAFDLPAVYQMSSGLGGGTHEFDVGDVDLDGDLDLVAADAAVVTFLNQGAPNFTQQSFNPGLGELASQRLADLNGDAYPDFVVIDHPTSPPYEFHVGINNGAGSFVPLTSYLIGSCGPGDVVAVDYDADGDRDIVITEYLGCAGGGNANKLFRFTNNGAGQFSAMLPIATFQVTQPERIQAGDLDHDGDQDLVTTHSGSIVVWRNLGGGQFAPPWEFFLGDWGAKFLTLEDLDGDGDLDAATSNFGNTSRGECVCVLKGYGDATFGPSSIYYGCFSMQYGSISGIEPLDADNDGDSDLAVGVYGADDIAIFLNRGDATFEPEQRYGIDGTVSFVRAGDFDGDGRADIAASVGIGPPLASAMTFLYGKPGGGSLVSTYCFCTANAPCANVSASGGCANSTGAGAQLVHQGSTSVSANDLFVTASSLPLFKSGLIVMAKNAQQVPFGDGQLCLKGGGGSGLYRFPGQTSGAGGAFSFGPIVSSTLNLPAVAHIQPGQSWNFQAFYRDPPGPCGGGVNWSNALAATFVP